MANTTLLEYANTNFPGGDTEVSGAGTTHIDLTSHTVVAHVVGSTDAEHVAATMKEAVGAGRVATVLIRPVDVSVIPDAEEDPDGTFDLPHRRVGVAALVGALVGAMLGFGAGLLVSGVAAAAILAGFAAVIGGVLGAVSGGGARHAGGRATSQPQAPGRNIAIVAAFLTDEGSATDLARTISVENQQYDVRIVGTDGAWHSPNN